ncbi:unnamed protein product [Rotaria magnacalcarata]|uniref:Purple acid phosphatase n=3 Tax=Rotaria magnacalcarata TaxID=392030 RepID=A0A816X8B0_9BILA|nr:unnamed protein product [Rotaria magnacalcarata]
MALLSGVLLVTFCNIVLSRTILFDDPIYGQPEQIHLSYGLDPTLMVVTWVTLNEINDSVVEYGQLDMFDKRATGNVSIFQDGGTEQRREYIHRVVLYDLIPGQKYFYHCGSDDYGWSPLFWFTAMRNDSNFTVRMAIYGDMGKDNAQSMARLQEETELGHFDLILHVGDMAYDMNDDNARFGDQYMNSIESIAAYIPYMTCPGNHENAYNFSQYVAKFSMPSSFNTYGGDSNHFYSFNVGPVHVVSFSTEFYYYLQYGFEQIVNQYKWLEEDLKNANKPENRAKQPWIITMGHRPMYCINIPANAKWSQNGVTIAGGNGSGNATNQLNSPCGLFVDDDQTVTIADWWNNRIIQWKNGDTTNGQVVAGGNGEGNGLNQLNGPTDVLIDKETDSLIICDYENQRVVRWSRRSGTTQGEILIDNIHCWGLAMDKQRYIYVSHYGINEVRRYQLGEQIGTLVAGGNGAGDGLNQLNVPTYLFVDRQQNVYVSDKWNHRVIKWEKGAKEGIVVAGGQGQGNALTQLYHPTGLFVDTLGTLYVADSRNHRIMRWTQGDNKQGTVVVGGNGQGAGANQFNYPTGLSFDRHGNLYVAEYGNNRVQRFSIEKDL